MEFKDMKFGEILALKYNFDFEVINDALSLQISNDKYKDLKLGEILKEQNKIEDDLINEVLKIQEKEIPTIIFNQNVTSNELLMNKENNNQNIETLSHNETNNLLLNNSSDEIVLQENNLLNLSELDNSIKEIETKIAEAKNGLVDALSLYPDSSSNEQLQIWFVCVKEG